MFVQAVGDEARTCGRCGESKAAADFAWRRVERKQRDNLCRPCRAAYRHEHYLANKQRYVDQARARKQDLRRIRTLYLLDYFARHPCSDCGERDPIVLEFDHVDEERKSFDIGPALAYRNWTSILAEIDKCEVVCANCHRRRTATRRGSLRALLAEMPRRDG